MTEARISISTRDVIRILAITFGAYLLLKFIWVAHPVLFLCFLGALFGLPLASGADWLEKRRVRRGLGVAIILVAFFGLLTAGGAAMAPLLRTQSAELQQRLPEAMDKIDAWLGVRTGGVLGLLVGPSNAADSVRVVEVVAPATGLSAGDSARQAKIEAGSQVRRGITRQFRGAQHSFLRVLTSTVTIGGALALVVFLAAYIAADPDLYHGGILRLVPADKRSRAERALENLAVMMRRWLVTQLIAMLVIGAVTTAFLLVIHVKAALPLGILAGLSKFIPIVGSIFAAIPAVAMAFIDSPHKAVVVGVGYVLIQFLENHLLVPVLMKRGVDLPPALTLAAQAVMAVLFGFMGLLLAVPILVAVLTVSRAMSSEDVRALGRETRPAPEV